MSEQDSAEFLGPAIGSVAPGIMRPLWSVMIPTCNCALFLIETLESVLRQAPQPDRMEIVVVDDVSNEDDPEAVARQVGGDRVRFVRNEKRLGVSGNFNRCLEISRGELVHILHGDDFVAAGFYREIEALAARFGDCAFYATRSTIIDEDGNVKATSEDLAAFELPTTDVSGIVMAQPFRTPSVVVRRSFYERHGGFALDLVHCADWEMWVRAIRLGSGVTSPEALAFYRTFEGNDSSRLVRTGEAIRDHMRIADRYENFPGFNRQRFTKMWAKIAFARAQLFLKEGDTAACQANLDVYRALWPAWRRWLYEFRKGKLRTPA